MDFLTILNQSDYHPKPEFGQPVRAQRILVLAPHPDDEVLGCGGTLFRYFESDADVAVYYLTDGRYGAGSRNANARKTESRRLKEFFPRIRQIYRDAADCSVGNDLDGFARDLSSVLKRLTPQLIFAPWMLDRHPDHQMTAVILAKALLSSKYSCLTSSYEIMYPLFANQFVDITRFAAKKQELIEIYESQVRRFNVLKISRSLNRFRAHLTRRPSILAAEGFYTAQSNFFTSMVKYLFPNKMNH